MTPQSPTILTVNGNPLTIPEGPVAPDMKKAITDAVSQLVPPDKKLVVLGGFTENGTAHPEAGVTAAYRINDHWQLAGNADYAFGGGGFKGYAGIVGVY